MGFSAALTKVTRGIGHIARRGGLVGTAIESVEAYGIGRGLGYVHGKYRDQTDIKGVPIELYGGIGAKVAGILATLYGGHMGGMVGEHLNLAGTVALGSLGYAHGVADGTKSSGRKVYVLDAGQAAPKELGGLRLTDVLGIDPAVGGAYLSADELAEWARQG